MLRFLLWILSAAVVSPVEVHAVPQEPLQPIHVELRRVGKLYLIEGTMEVASPRDQAWAVITDYRSLPAFLSSVRRSEVRERRGNQLEVSQEIRAKVLFVQKDLHLRLLIEESRPETLLFRDVQGRDFITYSGSWTLTAHGAGTTLRYELRLIPKFPLPLEVGKRALQSSATNLMTDLRDEILRRSHLNPPTPTSMSKP